MFLNTVTDGAEIEFVVDLTPRKQGMYVPGTGQLVVSPEQIREFRPDVVLCPHPTEYGRFDHMDAGRFAVNILGEHQEELSRLFATKGADRFGQTDWHLGVGGSPVLHDVLAYLDCEFWAEYDGGDHIIVVGRVLDLGVSHHAAPLVFFRGEYVRVSR